MSIEIYTNRSEIDLLNTNRRKDIKRYRYASQREEQEGDEGLPSE